MNTIQLHIPQPCNASWTMMAPNDEGRFCASCAKTVVDFSAMSDEELVHYFKNYSAQNICGRIKQNQLNRQLSAEPVPAITVASKRKTTGYFWKMAAAFLMLWFKGQSGKAQGTIKTALPADTTHKPYVKEDIPIMLGGIRPLPPDNQCVLPARITHLFVTDKNKKGIGHASVLLLPQNQWVVADSAGKINLPINHQVSDLKISAIGYREKQIALKKIKGNHVELEPATETMGEVVVQSSGNNRSLSCGLTMGSVIRVNKTDLEKADSSKIAALLKSIILAPNPVKAGATISVNAKNKIRWISIANAGGTILLKQQQANEERFSIAIPGNWSRGTYILNCYNADGILSHTEKFMVL